MSSADVDDLRKDLSLANLARAALAKRVRSLEAQLQRAHAERDRLAAQADATRECVVKLREQTELASQLVDKLNDICSRSS